MTSSNDQIPIHRDYEDNKAFSKDLIKNTPVKLPLGMRIYLTSHGIGISYRHPINAPGHITADLISFNQDHNAFIAKTNYACNFFYKMAKRMQKYYGPKPSITDT